jgi:hypothetical protein
MRKVILSAILISVVLISTTIVTGLIGVNETKITQLPYPINGASSVYYNNKIYVIGGINNNNQILNSVYIYDILNNYWIEGPSLPLPLYKAASIVINNTIYVIGGSTPNNVSPYIFKLINNQWIIEATIPKPVYSSIVFAWNDKIFIIGGFTRTSAGTAILAGAYSATNLVQIYDIRTRSWSIYSAPIAIGDAGYVFNGTHLIVVGGYAGPSQFSSSVYVYDPASGIWSKLTDFNYGVFGEVVGYYEGIIIVSGGIISSIDSINGNRNTFAFYKGNWILISNNTVPIYDSAYVQIGRYIYIAGGINWATSTASNELIKMTILTPPPKPKITSIKISNQSIIVSWNAENASYFRIIYWNDYGFNSSIIVYGNSYTITNLKNGVKYYFRIIPYNEMGEGSPSEIAYAIPGTVPLPPIVNSVKPGYRNLTISWSMRDNGGYPILGYYIGIKYNSSPIVRWINIGNTTSYVLRNLEPARNYTILIVAYNQLGNSSPAVVYGVPQDVPYIINITARATNNGLLIQWRSSYEANFSLTILDSNGNLILQKNLNNTNEYLANVSYGNYTIILIAKNMAGSSKNSLFVTYYLPPPKPKISIAITSDTLIVSWVKIPYATYYRVMINNYSIVTASTQVKMTLSKFGNYTVSVVAYNPAGASEKAIISFSYSAPTLVKITGSLQLQQNLIAVANVANYTTTSTTSSMNNLSSILIVLLLIIILAILIFIGRKI